MTKFKANFIVEACKYPQKNRRGQFSNENISNYLRYLATNYAKNIPGSTSNVFKTFF
jgi:hypothetical protein